MAMDNYYRPSNPRRRNRFLPFLFLVALGVGIVWAVSWWFQYRDTTEDIERNKVFLYFEQGGGQILPWGTTDWVKAYSGQVLWEGDTLRTSANSRAVLAFYDGTLLRMDESSELSLSKITEKKDAQQVEMLLGRGAIWVNESEASDELFSLIVRTDDLKINSLGTIFAVTQKLDNWVRVIEGQVQVAVLDRAAEKERVLETYTVGVGQQVKIGYEELQQLKDFQPLSLIDSLDAEFKASDWYFWNEQEDLSPTDFAKEKTLTGEEILDETVGTGTGTVAETTGADATKPVVTVTDPAETPFETDENSIDIKGAANELTARIKGVWLHEDDKDEYFLRHYEAGDETWRYSAAVSYGNMKPGENRYRITGIDAEGNEGETVEVTVNLVTTVSEEVLTVPTIVSFNEEVVTVMNFVYTTDLDRVEVKGACSARTYKLVVNDFALTKKDPGSTEWTYFADVMYDNFKEGENVYQVYAEDLEGNKSEMVEFKIIKEVAEESEEDLEEALAETQKLLTFAQCLKDRGMVLYKQDGCAHCAEQLETFGEAVSALSVVDCSVDQEACQEVKIDRVPTWVYSGNNHVGKKTLSELGAITGCVF